MFGSKGQCAGTFLLYSRRCLGIQHTSLRFCGNTRDLLGLDYRGWACIIELCRAESMHTGWRTTNWVHSSLLRVASWTFVCIASSCWRFLLSGERKTSGATRGNTTSRRQRWELAVTRIAVLGDLAIENWEKRERMIMWMWVSLCASY